MIETPETPDCIRCGEPVAGWRVIGAAVIHAGPEAGFYACGNCATIEEHHAHLQWLLARGQGHWKQPPEEHARG